MQLFLLMTPALLMGIWIGYEIGKDREEDWRDDALNARQALKKVSEQLEGAAFQITQMTADIKRYNQCIDGMIAGGSPCPWCEDYKECQLQAKTDGKGCELWMLSFPDGPTPDGDPAPDGEKGAKE